MRPTVQQIGKTLNKAGFKKASTKRENFETIYIGHYEATHLKCYGLDVITILPKNGTSYELLQNALSKYKTEYKNGYIIIK